MGPRDAVAMARIEAAQQQYQVQKDKYERLRSDVAIKLKFLEENKVRSIITSSWTKKTSLSRFNLSSVIHDVQTKSLTLWCLSGEGDA